MSSIKPVHHSTRRYWGMVVIIMLFAIVGGLYACLAMGIHGERNTPYEVVQREPYKQAFSPLALAELGLPPNSGVVSVQPSTPEIRAISLYTDHIELRAAGVILKKMVTAPLTDLTQLKSAVNDPAWIEEPTAGHYVLKAALVIHQQVTMTIGAPFISDVSLLDEPSVLIGVDGGVLNFDSVTIRSIEPPTPTAATYYHPSVIANNGAIMNITNSHFTNLGWDWNASYGVSWVVGASGKAVHSQFDHNFIGAYTSSASNILFQQSTFNDNALYGLDPHTYSKNLVIEDVVAEGNRAHGIIFSDHVTDSVIRRATSRGNGENGIMMDESSINNVIENSIVTDNSGDGLVTTDSPHNQFTGNTVERNRVGIRVGQTDAPTLQFQGNWVTDNDRVSENVNLGGTNVTLDNGGQPNWPVIGQIWTLDGMAVAVFMLAFALLRRRTYPSHRPVLTTVH